MGNDFRDVNPYESSSESLIVATLVEHPRPIKKRHPMLAAVFLMLGTPLLALAGFMLGATFWASQETPRPNFVIPVAIVSALFSMPLLLVAGLCLKELVQYCRGH